jgi:hypothetical protein
MRVLQFFSVPEKVNERTLLTMIVKNTIESSKY